MKVSFSPEASEELRQTVIYIARDDLNAAISLADDIEHFCFMALAVNPELGRPYGAKMRQAIKRGYRIIYQITQNEIEIIRVLHPSRNYLDIVPEE